VDNASLVPPEFQRTKVVIDVDKTAVREHWKATGEIATGCGIVRYTTGDPVTGKPFRVQSLIMVKTRMNITSETYPPHYLRVPAQPVWLRAARRVQNS
jgi:hypothetical protein